MSFYHRRREGRPMFFGLLLVCVGIIMLLDRLDYIDSYDYFRYWPVFIILFGVMKIAGSRSSAGAMAGVVIVCVGALIFFHNTHLFHIYLHDWWPLLIILIGVSILFSKRSHSYYHYEPPPAPPPFGGTDPSAPPPPPGSPDTDAPVNIFTFMGGCDQPNTSQDFKGGEISTILGGCKLDLRQASITTAHPVLNIFALCGGIEILVPRDWYVVMNGHPILGGIHNWTVAPSSSTQKQLIITGHAIMAGVEIKN